VRVDRARQMRLILVIEAARITDYQSWKSVDVDMAWHELRAAFQRRKRIVIRRVPSRA